MKKLRISALGAIILLPFSGCVQEGINSYYAGDFEKALVHLTPLAEEYREVPPGVKVRLKGKEVFERECHLTPDWGPEISTQIREKTELYYEAWMAFAGSLWAVREGNEACEAICDALRPLTLTIARCKWHPTLNAFAEPFQESLWPNGVQRLRLWWNQDFGCAATTSCEHADGISKPEDPDSTGPKE